MQELLKNAWEGWLNYTDAGKLAALLFAILLYLWFLKKYKEQHDLTVYTTIMTVLCIFPVTAAVLMVYQTRFYDYQWIWTLVPTTMMLAFGGTIFLRDCLNDTKKSKLQKTVVLLGLLAAVVLCGRLGNEKWQVDGAVSKKEAVKQLLEQVTEELDGRQMCLWAPDEVIELSGMVRGDITLLYGRNMWDKSLNAYSYDVYSDQVTDCYLWMAYVEDMGELDGERKLEGDKRELKGTVCVKNAVNSGVNAIVLPKNMKTEALEQVQNVLEIKAKELDDYYLFVLP